jgi:hypothetical protein
MSLLSTPNDYTNLYNNILLLEKNIDNIILKYKIDEKEKITIKNFYTVLKQINVNKKLYNNVLTKLSIKFYRLFISFKEMNKDNKPDDYDLYNYILNNDIIININDRNETNINISNLFKIYNEKKQNITDDNDKDDNINHINDDDIDDDIDDDDDDDDDDIVSLEEKILNCMKMSMIVIKSYYNNVLNIINCDYVIHTNEYFDILQNKKIKCNSQHINSIINSINIYLDIINLIAKQYNTENTSDITKRLISNVLNQIQSNNQINNIDKNNIDNNDFMSTILPILTNITSDPELNQDIEKIKSLSDNGEFNLNDFNISDMTSHISSLVNNLN